MEFAKKFPPPVGFGRLVVTFPCFSDILHGRPWNVDCDKHVVSAEQCHYFLRDIGMHNLVAVEQVAAPGTQESLLASWQLGNGLFNVRQSERQQLLCLLAVVHTCVVVFSLEKKSRVEVDYE